MPLPSFLCLPLKQLMSTAGGNKVEEAKKGADDAASAVKSAVPNQPQQAAKDAASAVQSALPGKPVEAAKDAPAAAKDNVPEPPKSLPNPFQSFFSGRPTLFV